MNADNPKELIDTLRLSEEQWEALSATLNADPPQMEGQRRHERVTFRQLSPIAVAIQQPNGDWAKYAVRSRDLSPGGIGFVHGHYVHTDSACRVIIKDNRGGLVCLEGTVKHCRLIEGSAAHTVGVMFNDEINVDQFIGDDDQKQAG